MAAVEAAKVRFLVDCVEAPPKSSPVGRTF